MEYDLENYLDDSARISYGLSSREICKFAYEYLMKSSILVAGYLWHTTSMASTDCLRSFSNDHATLSILTPQLTSLNRVTTFKRYNVSISWDILEEVMDLYIFDWSNIYNRVVNWSTIGPNCLQLSITTVQRLKRIIARKGVKQVDSLASEKWRIARYHCNSIKCNQESNIPPIFVFSKKKITRLLCCQWATWMHRLG